MFVRYLVLGTAFLLSAADLRSAELKSTPYVPKFDLRHTHSVAPLTIPKRRRAVTPPSSGANNLTSAPVPGDIVPTIDAPWSPEIKALGAQLREPMAMYAHVRDTISFEPYAGSRKGALLTLEQRAGNAMDTASLLAALVRSAGYPARYVSGRVVATQAQLQAWLGTPTVGDAAELLRTMGLAATVRADSSLEFEHTWLAVYVNGTWVQLDPSYKKIVVHGPSFPRAPVEPLVQFLSHGASTGAIDVSRFRVLRRPKVVSSVNPADPDFDIDLFERRWQQLYTWAVTNITSGTHTREIAGYTEIFGDASALPLPLAPGATLSAFSYVPDALRARFTIEIDPVALGVRPISYSASLPELVHKRITVTHVPATPEDEALVAQHGRTLLTAPVSIKIAPVIVVDGAIVVRGGPIVFNTVEHRRVTFTQPGLQTVRSENQMHAGDSIGVVIQYGRTSPAEVAAASTAYESVAPKPDAPETMSEPVNGAMLRLAGVGYFAQVTAFREIFARASGVRWVGGAAVVMAMQPMKFDPGVPVRGIEGISLGFDVPIDQLHAWRTTGSDARLRLYHAIEGRFASALEHHVWDSLGFRAVSAVKVMNLALRRGIPVHHNITKANWFDINRQFRVNIGVLIGVTDAVNAGMVVTLPEREVTLGDWTGTGYLVTDPKTNKSAYIISGRWGNGSVITANGGLMDLVMGALGAALAGRNMALAAEGAWIAAGVIAAASTPFGAILGGVALGAALGSMLSDLDDLVDYASGTKTGSELLAEQLANAMIENALRHRGIDDATLTPAQRQAFKDAMDAFAGEFAEIVADLFNQRSGRTHARLSEGELLSLALRNNSPPMWEDLNHVRLTRGWESLENLVRNSVYTDDHSLREIAHIVARAPEGPGLDELLPRVTGGQSYTSAYTLATAVWAHHSERYNRKVDVTFHSVIGFSENGDPLFGSARTESLTVPLQIYLGQWFFLMHEPVGPRDLRARNDVMKMKALVESGARSRVTLWTAGGMDEQLRDWIETNAKEINLTTHRGDSLR
jgi:hypothetical protein